MARRTSVDADDPRQFVRHALTYAEATAKDPTRASLHARLACERFLRDYEAARKPDSPWRYDDLAAMKAMFFVTQLPNIKGPLAGQRIALMDWQKLVYANVFGFKDRETGARRFRQGVVYVPRGNGKTTIAAPLALFMTFGEAEGGAEGYAAAVTRDQARILFDVAKAMVARTSSMRDRWHVGVLTNSIFQERTASKFVPISSDAKALDGLNVQVAVCDEIASHRTSEVYDVLFTAMGKRLQPFLLSISTATANTSGIGRQVWDYSMRVLTGAQQDDRLFSIIYSVDDTDDPWDEATWIKANPGWGVTVQPEGIRQNMRQARNNVSQEHAALTRHLNLWIGADEALYSPRAWAACADLDLRIDQFEGRPCYIGVDLASRVDLAAVTIVFLDTTDSGKPFYTAFARCYVNESAVREARNASYPAWERDGDLIVTPGNETDLGRIEEDIVELCARFDVREIAFDPHQAVQMMQRLMAARLPVVEFRGQTLNFTEPTKELAGAILAGRIRHDGNGCFAWCISNVVGKPDARENLYPKKLRDENKIDAAIALIMAIGRSMQAPPKSVYETRGLLSLE